MASDRAAHGGAAGRFSPDLAALNGIAGRIRSLYHRWAVPCAMHAIGFATAARLGERLGGRDPAFSGALRGRIRDALAEKTDEQNLDDLVRQAAVHMYLNIVETEFIFRMITASTFERRVRIAGFEPIIENLRRGRGVVAASAYLGNHLAGVTAAAHLLRGNVAGIVTPRQFATQYRWMRGMAVRRLAMFQSSAGAVRGSLRFLRQGRLLTLIAEHPSRSRAAVRTPFLGAERAFHPTPALLARRAHCPIAVVTCTRIEPMRFELRVVDWIEPAASSDSVERAAVPASLRASVERASVPAGGRGSPPHFLGELNDSAHGWIDSATRRVMASLEREILRTPGQYAWLKPADIGRE